jgi:beta-glucosidase
MQRDNKFTRRSLLSAAAAVAAFGSTEDAPSAAEVSGDLQVTLPRSFMWGASTAGYQIEGNVVGADLWVLENVKPTIFAERSGDACDSYHRYEEDIGLLKSFGLDTYRFSLEWARIEPEAGEFSNAELDHYKRLIDACRENGVKPAVTFNHWTCPRWFASAGGWSNIDSPKVFARFCARAAKHLVAGMEIAMTLNEPNGLQVIDWLPGMGAMLGRIKPIAQQMNAAAMKATGSDRFVTSIGGGPRESRPNLIAAHEAAYGALKAERGDLPVGVTLAMVDFQGEGPNSRAEEARSDAYAPWFEAIRRAGDFTGVQNYGRTLIDAKGPISAPAGVERNGGGDEFYPAGLGNMARYAHRMTGKPICVTENGINTKDDKQRIRYIDAVLAGLLSAIRDGVPVLGYLHWSLLDNFEWTSGYKPTFGLVAVDRTTFKRTPKPSAYHLGAIARANRA